MKKLNLKINRFVAMKKWELALLLGLVLSIVFTQFVSFASDCNEVVDKTLRFHVIANSNSQSDQDLKLQVRDVLLNEYGEKLANAQNLDDAIAIANENKQDMQRTATQFIAQQGYNYKVNVSVQKMYFHPKQYDNFTLPAGEYDAVRVEIGNATGENWFCVLYPALCLPAASENNSIEVYTSEERDAIQTPYTVKFAVLEWAQNLGNKN